MKAVREKKVKLAGRICETGRFQAGSEGERELWSIRENFFCSSVSLCRITNS